MRILIPTLAVALAVSASAQSGSNLGGAREDLRHREEGRVRAGGEKCVEANSVEAVELMLDVVFNRERRPTNRHLSVGHYRDVLMEFLCGITDVYARRRVQQELLKNKQFPFVRQWCAEALGIYGDHDGGPALTKALSDRHSGVRRWAAWSIGRIKWPHATKKLFALAKNKDDYVRGNAIEALARVDSAHVEDLAVAARNDKSAGVRAALVHAAPAVAGDRVEPISVAALQDPDWRPRMQAVKNLSTIRTKTAVDALIPALRDGRPVVARRALVGLQALTGQPITQVDVWPKWWADNRESFQFPEGESEKVERKGDTTTFLGIPIDSDHVAFVVDKSIWMQQQLTSKAQRRDAAAVEELGKVLSRLHGRLTFNVYVYDEEVRSMSKNSAELSKRSERRALKFASAEATGRHKNMWLALESVVAEEDIDTIYLISSGEADEGLYVHGNRIGRHLEDMNRFFQTTVHAFCFSSEEWHQSHVKAVSDATGGEFQIVD